MLPWLIICVLALGIAALIVREWLLKRDMRDLSEQIRNKLEADTNVSLRISSRDRQLRKIASELNEQLGILRKQQLQYMNGSLELKNAVTNISHDLRTPLTAIYGYLDIMNGMEKFDDVQRCLDIIAERTQTMKQLTEQLFRYSVILSDESPCDIEDVLINKVLEDSIMSYYPALQQNKIAVNVHITENRIIRRANSEYLSRIFANLLNNALKYSRGDLDIQLSDDGAITFSNTADDLSAVQVERLFDRFYTVEAARNSTGLGLSIARTLAERMGGTITAVHINGRLTITLKI